MILSHKFEAKNVIRHFLKKVETFGANINYFKYVLIDFRVIQEMYNYLYSTQFGASVSNRYSILKKCQLHPNF